MMRTRKNAAQGFPYGYRQYPGVSHGSLINDPLSLSTPQINILNLNKYSPSRQADINIMPDR
jgi:hypothetical protein